MNFDSIKKTPLDRTMERIVALSKNISIPQESIYTDQSKKPTLASAVDIPYKLFRGPEPFKASHIKSIRDFYQAFYNWFKKPVGALSPAVQEELNTIFKEFEDPACGPYAAGQEVTTGHV